MANEAIRFGAKLLPVSSPLVMAIINVTPDSFFAPSRASDQADLRAAILRAVDEGADILDIGACSTRPSVQNGKQVLADAEQEWQRLSMALGVVREMNRGLPVSVDTFRPEIARQAIEQFGVEMINDISGGSEQMFSLVAEKNVAYVLTYNRPADAPATTGHLLADCIDYLSRRVDLLHRLGVSDVVIDPGFGFNQSVQQSLFLLDNLRALTHIGCPILAGISRKRMAYEPHGLTPETCLEPTLNLERKALEQGAAILRVHDITATKKMITMKGN